MKSAKKVLALFLSTTALAACHNESTTPLHTQQDHEKAHAAPTYYVDVKLKQSHLTLSLKRFMADSLNDVNFSLPTAYPEYKTLHVGEDLVDKFRMASLLLDNSAGRTRLIVADIPAVDPRADKSSCKVELQLKESHFSLNPLTHIKDSFNAVTFDWEIPKPVNDGLKTGHDFIQHGFKLGSFMKHGSIGNWHLRVIKKYGCTP